LTFFGFRLSTQPTRSANIDSFDEQNIESEAIYGIKSTNAPLTNIPDILWVSSLNPTYAIGDRTYTLQPFLVKQTTFSIQPMR
jgi:hypothetical protein